MTKRMQVYKCDKCGGLVEVFGPGAPIVCCGQPMTLQDENTVDAAREKHVPLIERVEEGIKVAVGAVAHPMSDEHYIQWIEVVNGDRACQAFLKPGDAPEAVFAAQTTDLTVRAYCNLHGHWKA